MKIIKLFKETNELQRVITLLNNRNSRHRYQEFIIEGRNALDEAYRMGWKVKSIFFNRDTELSPWAKTQISNQNYDTAYSLPSLLMDKISDKTDRPELVAIGEMQSRHFSSYKPNSNDVVIVLDEPKSPGNVGMMIRSAVAFGAKALVISGHGADEYDPKCIRSTVGTFFSLPIYRVEGVNKFAQKIEEIRSTKEVAVFASGDKGSALIEETDFKADVLFLVLGNETTGISAGYKQIADQFVRIPLEGKFTSLNIGAAGSIFLYEIFRQRKNNL